MSGEVIGTVREIGREFIYRSRDQLKRKLGLFATRAFDDSDLEHALPSDYLSRVDARVHEIDVPSWSSLISGQLESTSSQYGTVKDQLERAYRLEQKAYRRENTQVSTARLIGAIARKYGDIEELGAKIAALSQKVLRYNQQLAAMETGEILLFADDLDEEFISDLVPSPGELPARFRAHGLDPLPTHPDEAMEYQHHLPFVAESSILRSGSQNHPHLTLKGPLQFPVERIIGIQSFEGWFGRGSTVKVGNMHKRQADGLSVKRFDPIHLPENIEQTSRAAILEYAHSSASQFSNRDGAHITLVKDAAGECWGIAETDGSHRVAAAKLRGDKTVEITYLNVPLAEDMDLIPFSVTDRFQDD